MSKIKSGNNQGVNNFTLVAHYISPRVNLNSHRFTRGDFMLGEIQSM